MIRPCPTQHCPFFGTKDFVKKDGKFYRLSESRYIQRYKCNSCKTKFSNATGTLEFKQKKRRVNEQIRQLFCSSVSMRRMAKILNVNRITVERKMVFLSLKAKRSQAKMLKGLSKKVMHMQFDDLITIEHTKLKPVTVSLAVDAETRMILGANVATIGAFGHLADLSRRKYGFRENKHTEALEALFNTLRPLVHPLAKIESDEHKRYAYFVKKHFPQAEYFQYKGGRGCIVGQGELKKLGFDPLFILNHTCAMLRANINRLVRKTWCTTKSLERLQMHLDIFVEYYNRSYLKLSAPQKWGS